jgi:aspartate aminotransferase-like enzyme
MISLMPGPVEIAEPIRQAFVQPPISHRSSEFVHRFEAVRSKLSRLTRAPRVALFQGSGTLANDVIASQLDGPGLVLVNGEFGARLVRQARARQLPVHVLEWPWGARWDLDRVEAALEGVAWIWGVHLETSTGVLNDIGALRDLAGRRGVRLCLDCVSSLGAAPLDLSGIWLASGSSGKALGAYAGISMVFAQVVFAQEVSPVPRPVPRYVPEYLDLDAALRAEGSRFTFSSPLLMALDAALEIPRDYAPLGNLVRRKLRDRGVAPMADGIHAAPTVTTFAPPVAGFTELCRSLGYWIGGESSYLARRGLAQVATMGAVGADHIEDLFRQLVRRLA